MSRRRLQRLNEQLKRELSELIRTQVRDPRIGLVTVTAVDITSDLSLARVYVRILGDDAEVEEGMAGLAAAAPFMRTALGQELSIRRIPELRFQHDQSMEHALRIERILADVLPEGAVDADVGGAGPVEGGSSGQAASGAERGASDPDMRTPSEEG